MISPRSVRVAQFPRNIWSNIRAMSDESSGHSPGGNRAVSEQLPGNISRNTVKCPHPDWRNSRKATHTPLCVWRYYKGRADCENVIKELQAGFALPRLCLENFWASEAALSLAVLTYNLVILFERHLGWQQTVTLRSLRFWLFVTAGVLSHPAGKTTIKLAVPERERDWWRRLWEKILSPLPICNAVENHPAFTTHSA